MLEERERVLSNSPPLSPKSKGRSPQSPGRAVNKQDSEVSSNDDDSTNLTPNKRKRIDSVIRRAGGGHAGSQGSSPGSSPPRHSITSTIMSQVEKRSRHMERTMSMTSAFGAQGTGGGAIAGHGGGGGGEYAMNLDDYIGRKEDEAEAKILAKMESIANAFIEENGR